MNIIRAGFDDTDIFSKMKLENGACCFYSEDRTCRYFFKIDGKEAVLFADKQQYIDEAIDEFLFYSNFITCIKYPDGSVLRDRNTSDLELFEIHKIQPSQFFINERKLNSCKRWIKSHNDIMIPIAVIDGKVISLDGHTRLRAALDLGYKRVYVFKDDYDEYITSFVNEAVNRGILNISNMEIISDVEYKIKWHKFCDDFFKNH